MSVILLLPISVLAQAGQHRSRPMRQPSGRRLRCAAKDQWAGRPPRAGDVVLRRDGLSAEGNELVRPRRKPAALRLRRHFPPTHIPLRLEAAILSRPMGRRSRPCASGRTTGASFEAPLVHSRDRRSRRGPQGRACANSGSGAVRRRPGKTRLMPLPGFHDKTTIPGRVRAAIGEAAVGMTSLAR